MTFFTGTQTELLYSMPVIPAVKSAFTTATVISSTTDPCQLPAPLWQPGQSNGYSHSIMVFASGGYGTTTSAPTFVWTLNMTTTEGTLPGSLLLTTPTLTPAVSVTAGVWQMEAILTFSWTAATTLSCNATGQFSYGVPATVLSATTNGSFVMGTTASGVMTPVSLVPTTPYFLEIGCTCGTSAAANLVSTLQFLVFGCN